MKLSLRKKAEDLRRAGWSYNIIADRLGLSKSTLSNWLREIPFQPNLTVQKRILAGPAKSAARNHARKISSIELIRARAGIELGKLTHRDLWMLGLGIYLGEGSKIYEITRITNSDPDILRVSVRWLREICGVPLDNFDVRLHIYPDTDQKLAEQYWEEITGIPSKQFQKVSVDRRLNKKRKNQGKLPFGTAHITILSHGIQKHGVFLHRRIMGWIHEVMKQMRV